MPLKRRIVKVVLNEVYLKTLIMRNDKSCSHILLIAALIEIVLIRHIMNPIKLLTIECNLNFLLLCNFIYTFIAIECTYYPKIDSLIFYDDYSLDSSFSFYCNRNPYLNTKLQSNNKSLNGTSASLILYDTSQTIMQ